MDGMDYWGQIGRGNGRGRNSKGNLGFGLNCRLCVRK